MQGKFRLGGDIQGSMPDTCCIDDKTDNASHR